MTVLADHQFEILPTEDSVDGFVFGIGAEVSVNGEGWDPGETTWHEQDSVNSRRGTRAFGRDVKAAKTWLWESHVDRDEVDEAVDTLERFSDAWSPEDLMEDPGKQTALRYSIAGRVRRIYGRPRRFAAPPTNRILGGFVPVTHDFALVDGYTYDDAESSALVPFNSLVSEGGFTFPATFPLVTTASEGIGSTQLVIGGKARAYPIIRFNGPWTNPSIVTPDWELSWLSDLAAGEWVEIDTRPWVLTVLDQSGASAVEHLGRRTYLEDCWFAPGSRPLVELDGISTSGSATCSIRWRNTWKSI